MPTGCGNTRRATEQGRETVVTLESLTCPAAAFYAVRHAFAALHGVRPGLAAGRP